MAPVIFLVIVSFYGKINLLLGDFMADLSRREKNILESYLQMTGGHLLDFSHRTLAEFFEDYGIDITDECYLVGSGSKANKIRGFWTVSDNATFGRVLFGLIQKYDEDRASNDHLNNAYSYTSEYNESNRAKCLDIAYRLTMPQQAPVANQTCAAVWSAAGTCRLRRPALESTVFRRRCRQEYLLCLVQ